MRDENGETDADDTSLPAEYVTLNDLQRFLAQNRGLQFRFTLHNKSYRAAIWTVGGKRGLMMVSANGDSLDDAVNECLRRYEHDFPES